jgi:hypothetical protein
MKDYRISKSKVIGMDDANLAWAVIEPMWDDFDYSSGYKSHLLLKVRLRLSHWIGAKKLFVMMDLKVFL